MSRPAKRVGDFDKEKFSELLKMAKGNLKQADFADSVPMSRTYISSFINKQSDRPLMPKMLERIAAASEGRVSYEALLSASGYDPAKYTNNSTISLQKSSSQNEELLGSIIMGNLRRAPFTWTSGQSLSTPRLPFDFSISPIGNDIDFWHFSYMCIQRKDKFNLENLRLSTYGKLAEIPGLENAKITIVTNSVLVYNSFVNNKPLNLGIFLSIVLIDIDAFSIKSEETLFKPEYIPNDCQIRFNL